MTKLGKLLPAILSLDSARDDGSARGDGLTRDSDLPWDVGSARNDESLSYCLSERGENYAWYDDISRGQSSNLLDERHPERSRGILTLVISALLSVLFLSCQPEYITLQVRNPLEIERKGEIISILRSELPSLFDLPGEISVIDQDSKQILPSQKLDLDQDGAWDELLIMVDLGPLESREYIITPQASESIEPRVFGRLIPERKDDFAWENDRIAFRMYGPALEQSGEISSGVDVWTKSVDKLIIDPWYAGDDYHKDHGEGGDFYKVGPTLGCGGLGLLVNDTLFTSRNFIQYRILADGPLRFVFELDYASWGSADYKFTETKRMSLDAGQYFNLVESRLTGTDISSDSLRWVAGLASHPKQSPQAISLNSSGDYMSLYEAFKGANGWLGTAIIREPSNQKMPVIKYGDQFLFGLSPAEPLVPKYYAGAAWSKSPGMPDEDSWIKYMKDFQMRSVTPIIVEID